MQLSNANQDYGSNDPVWQFLAEYSLSEFKPDHGKGDELTAGLLFQTIRDLGIPPECLNKIERTLIEFFKQTTMHFNQGKREFPIMIRLFNKKKMIKSGNSIKTANDLQAKQTIEPMQMIHPAETKIFGGWGFFLIERARDFQAGSLAGSPNLIDLYLYQEGE